MAGNFKISVIKANDHVLLKLNGDFDGSSACELLNMLNNGQISGIDKIVVDMASLQHIDPFGLKVLRSRLHELKSRRSPLIFTGKSEAWRELELR